MTAEKTVAHKARVKPGTRFAAPDPVPGVIDSLELPDPVFTEPQDAEIVLLVPLDRGELEGDLRSVVAALVPGAAVWVFFRKGSKAAGVDLSRDAVWAAAEPLGFRPLGLLSVDDTWSVFRLRRS